MPTVVMTGGTSGFGAIAAERIGLSAGARLILGARRPPSHGEWIPLDLAGLNSVRAFAGSVGERLGDTRIDALVLNAGVILQSIDGRTDDGFETTFAVNHLAPYLLSRVLLPVLANEAVVVLTTSGAHDPDTRAGLAAPRHADAMLLANPERDPGCHTRPRRAAEHAYTASKLCTVLTARSLSMHRDIQARRITVVAYDPGQVFGTALARDLPARLRIAWSLMGTPMAMWLLGRFDRHLNSRKAAGHTLANLALGLESPPHAHMLPCDEGGSPGRTRRHWHAEMNWRRDSGTTAPDSLACRPDAG